MRNEERGQNRRDQHQEHPGHHHDPWDPPFFEPPHQRVQHVGQDPRQKKREKYPAQLPDEREQEQGAKGHEYVLQIDRDDQLFRVHFFSGA